ncbi:mucin-2-like [Solea solea]|uniref:mucin-2-like n=1 Tax=Solea solea TaxID=90069 RepID=UPI00272A7DF3|nr:mucin-2-like [Solea solea]
MSMFLVLLLQLFFSVSQATNFLGTVMTYDPETNSDGIFTVALRFKTNFQTCSAYIPWECRTGDCTTVFLASHTVSNESSGEWCHREGLMILQITGNDPFQLWLNGNAWKSNINGIVSVRALTLVDPRTRSDTGKANRSPQTTMLPVLRVPSNCPRQIRLLAFDPDGDNVQCRYGNQSQFECNPCTPPPVLTLSSSCDLSFSATNSSAEGLYAVQLVMEDSPGQPITLARGGVVTPITTTTPISKIPVQFAFKVDPAVPSCTGGLYLPGFQSPTPANRAQLQASVNQVLQISIKAVAANSAISELLFSGPHNINQTRSGAGDFTLSWTPSVSQSGENHPICFVVQAVSGSNRYQSELRCVIVIVANSERRLPRAVPASRNITNATAIATTTPPLTSPTTVAVTSAVSQPSTITTTTPTTTPALTIRTAVAVTSAVSQPSTIATTTPTTTPALTPPTTVPVTSAVSQPSTITTTTPTTTPALTPRTTVAVTSAVSQPSTFATTTPTTTPPTTPINTTTTPSTIPFTTTTTPINTTTTPPTIPFNTTTTPPTIPFNTTTTPSTIPFTTTTTPPTTPINTTTTPPTIPVNATTTPPTIPFNTTTTPSTIPFTTTTTPPTTPINTTTTPSTTPINTTTTPPTTPINTTTTPPTIPFTTTTTPPTTTFTTTTTPTTTPFNTTTTAAITTANTEITTTTAGPVPTAGQVVLRLKARITSVIELTEDEIRNIVLPQFKNQLVTLGVPNSVNVTLVSVL